MDFSLTDEQKLFQKIVREFCEKEIKPISKKIDKEEYFPEELYKKMGRMGLMGMTVPQKYGGAGIDKVSYMIALEEISRFCGSTGITVEAHNTLGIGYIYEAGSEDQRKKYLPKYSSGEAFAALAITEPNAGSDVGGIQTNAILNDEEIYLFDPKDTPKLIGVYGEEFEKAYNYYINKASIRKKKVNCLNLFVTFSIQFI